MPNTLRIKRRAAGGAAGAPASLANAELAFNEQDDVLYYGKGTGGAGGTATSVEAIGGRGAFVGLNGDQSIAGAKTFTGEVYVPTPTALFHAVNKAYADALVPNVVAGANILVNPAAGSVTIALDGASANTANKAVVRDGSGNFSAGTITAALAGNANTASALQTARSISATGDATWTVNFDGSANATAALTLKNTGTAGTYTKVTTDAQGRVTSGSSLAATDIPTVTAAKISDFDTQVRSTRLDQMAAPTAPVAFNGQRASGLAEPTNAQDAATKNYVDSVAQGLAPKQSVRAATTANIASLSGAITIDGVSLVAGDRVLVKDQSTPAQNGIYVVAAGAWARAADANAWAELVSAFVFVEQGTTNADNGFICTVDQGGTLGTTAVTFAQFSGAGQIIAGAGLTKTGNQIDVGAGTGIAVAADTVGLTGQALALHNLGTNGIFVRTGAGTVAARSVAASGSGLSVASGDGVAGNPTISLTAALASIGGLTPAADRLPYYTGGSTADLAVLTAFGRSLLDDADAAAGRATLGLGTMATQNANNVNITGGSIDNLVIDGGTF